MLIRTHMGVEVVAETLFWPKLAQIAKNGRKGQNAEMKENRNAENRNKIFGRNQTETVSVCPLL